MINDLKVLLIDDDDVACESIMRSFRKLELDMEIVTAEDGLEGLEILRGQHESKRITPPFVILLDLNMPRMNGFEFLDELRGDPSIACHVVFILTTSSDDSDRARAYEKFIAGYMVKSSVGPQFKKLADLLQDYSKAITLKDIV
jgi:CheY-like chemotaxis protein